MVGDMVREFENDLRDLINAVDYQRYRIEELELEAAKWKAVFFHKTDLCERISDQQMKNGYYRSEKYRNLEDMVRDGLITKEEYDFCKP